MVVFSGILIRTNVTIVTNEEKSMPGIPGIARDVTAAVLASAILQALDEGEVQQRLQSIEELLSSDKATNALEYLSRQNEADLLSVINVPIAGSTPLRLSLHGRKYAWLWVPNGGEAVTIRQPGVSPVALTLSTGWNNLPVSDGAEIWLTSASATIDMLYRCTNALLPSSSGSATSSGIPDASSTLSSVAAATSSTTLAAGNSSRKAFYVYNDSSSAMYLAFAATATTTAYTVKVPANNFFEMPTSPVYTGAISGIWDTATGNARITEMS